MCYIMISPDGVNQAITILKFAVVQISIIKLDYTRSYKKIAVISNSTFRQAPSSGSTA